MNKRQLFIGFIALIFGGVYYLLVRPPETSYFVFRFFQDIDLFSFSLEKFPVGVHSLPSFIHPLAFILLSCGLLKSNRTECIVLSILWVAINWIFELGQLLSDSIANYIPTLFSNIAFLENFESYFIAGKCCPWDLIAILLGGIAGCFIGLMTISNSVEESNHACEM